MTFTTKIRKVNTCVIVGQGLKEKRNISLTAGFYINETNKELERLDFRIRLDLKAYYDQSAVNNNTLVNRHELCYYLHDTRKCYWPRNIKSYKRLHKDCEYSKSKVSNTRSVTGYVELGGFCKHEHTTKINNLTNIYEMHFGHLAILQVYEFKTDCEINATLTTNSIIHLLLHSHNYTHEDSRMLLTDNVEAVNWYRNGTMLKSFYNVDTPDSCIIENKIIESNDHSTFYIAFIVIVPLLVLYFKARQRYLRAHPTLSMEIS